MAPLERFTLDMDKISDEAVMLKVLTAMQPNIRITKFHPAYALIQEFLKPIPNK